MLSEVDIARLEQEMSVQPQPVAIDQNHLLFARTVANVTGDSSWVIPRYQDKLGWSVNAYSQYLVKALRRPSVQMLTKSCADRLVFQEDGAPTVELQSNSKDLPRRVHAKREVILAAGALGSPALLQRSGITAATMRDQADV